jgi:hypothetical protein
MQQGKEEQAQQRDGRDNAKELRCEAEGDKREEQRLAARPLADGDCAPQDADNESEKSDLEKVLASDKLVPA